MSKKEEDLKKLKKVSRLNKEVEMPKKCNIIQDQLKQQHLLTNTKKHLGIINLLMELN